MRNLNLKSIATLFLMMSVSVVCSCAKKKSKKKNDPPPPVVEEQKPDPSLSIVSVEASAYTLSTELTDFGDEIRFKVTFTNLVIESSSEVLTDFFITDGRIDEIQYVQRPNDCELSTGGSAVESGAFVFKSEDNELCREYFNNLEQNLTVQFILSHLNVRVGSLDRIVKSTFLTLKR